MKFVSVCRLSSLIAQALLVVAAPVALAQGANPAASYPATASRPIAGRYIVVFKASVSNPAAAVAQTMNGSGGQLLHTYSNAIKGFAANLPDAALPGIRNNPNVSYVEQDSTVMANQTTSPQSSATWGLDRIDQADLPLNGQYTFNNSGAGVTTFVIDTGIRADHMEFTGRVLPGLETVGDGNGTNDCNGHGTHVSGTVGGSTWGVAKAVKLVPVRVLDCTGSGSWSGVIAGIDWVAGSMQRPAVANLSLGGGASSAVDSAVAGAVAKGVVMVVAAGNSNNDACLSSPAREPSAITVGATTAIDYRASYSNFGSCVDIFAPGTGITSAWYTNSTATNLLSGTSMASPHVAGAAALALAANPTATPATVASLLGSSATPNRIVSASLPTGTPNLLINSLGSGGSASPTPTTVTVAYKSMIGSSSKYGGSWKASAAVTVRDINTGAAVPNATVTGSFSVGGSGNCVTGSSGSCTLTSGSIKAASNASTIFSGTGVSGTNLAYNASQNSVSQITIAKP